VDADDTDLHATGLSAAAELKTGSGDIELGFSGAPDEVSADASSGDVDIALPEGEAYRVDTDTSAGDDDTTVRTDPASTRTIHAKTSAGDIEIAYGD